MKSAHEVREQLRTSTRPAAGVYLVALALLAVLVVNDAVIMRLLFVVLLSLLLVRAQAQTARLLSARQMQRVYEQLLQ